jgi:hypothetical protein
VGDEVGQWLVLPVCDEQVEGDVVWEAVVLREVQTVLVKVTEGVTAGLGVAVRVVEAQDEAVGRSYEALRGGEGDCVGDEVVQWLVLPVCDEQVEGDVVGEVVVLREVQTVLVKVTEGVTAGLCVALVLVERVWEGEGEALCVPRRLGDDEREGEVEELPL